MLQNAKVFVVIVELKTSSPDFFRSPTTLQLGVSKQAIFRSYSQGKTLDRLILIYVNVFVLLRYPVAGDASALSFILNAQ